MLSQIKGFFKAPIFEDEDKTQIARTLNIVTLVLLGMWVAMSASVLLFSFPSFGRAFWAIPLTLFIRFLMRRGWVWLASQILSLSLWLVFSLVTLGQGGINSPLIRNYIIVIVVAGLLSGWRSAIGVA